MSNFDIDNLSNILGADLAKKIYEDAASDSLKEVGKIGVDMIKAFRLFTAPLQLLAAYQDRLTKFLNKVRDSVPKENQIEAPASISGPIIERLKYSEDNNPITTLYLSLLSRAIDKKRVSEAHPAFIHIIEQLSPDEALILYFIHKKPFFVESVSYYHRDKINVSWESGDYKYDDSIKTLIFPEHISMYLSHVQSLDLIVWRPQSPKDLEYRETEEHGRILKSRTFVNAVELSEFGKLFVKACLPEGGFDCY